jgi:hypothetical protein
MKRAKAAQAAGEMKNDGEKMKTAFSSPATPSASEHNPEKHTDTNDALAAAPGVTTPLGTASSSLSLRLVVLLLSRQHGRPVHL